MPRTTRIRTRWSIAPMLAAMLLLAACGSQSTSGPSALDVEAIRAIEEARQVAYNARDVAGIMKLYGPDLQVFHVIPPLSFNRAEFEHDFTSLYRMFSEPSVLTMSDLKINAGMGDIAYATCYLNLKGTRTDGGKTDLLMRITDVLQKLNGHWLIVHEHWSLPVDTESGKAELHAHEGGAGTGGSGGDNKNGNNNNGNNNNNNANNSGGGASPVNGGGVKQTP